MSKKILLVDDEPDIIKIVNYRLVKLGYDVCIAVNGREAFELLETLKPDLVVTDFKMPFMDGIELCNRIKADPRYRHIPIIMMTASTESTQRIKDEKVQLDEIIIKPFEAENMIATIRRYLGENG